MQQQIKITLLAAILVFATSLQGPRHIVGVQAAPSAVVEDYSVLPETFGERPDLKPNILIVIDNSGSMGSTSDEDGGNYQLDDGNAHDPRSNSYRVRTAFQNIFDRNADKINVGVMTFGAQNSQNGTVTLDDCRGYPGCGTPGNSINYYIKNQSGGKGILMAPVKSLAGTHLTLVKRLMDIEPETPSFVPNSNTNGGYSFRKRNADGSGRFSPGLRTYFSSQDDILDKGIIRSVGSTPLAGAMYSARRYLTLDALQLDTNGNNNEIHKSLWTNPNATSNPAVNSDVYLNLSAGAGAPANCRPDTYVFLLSDGRPTRNFSAVTSGASALNVSNTNGNVASVEEQVQGLKASGIETWVFGFALNNTDRGQLENIADDGRDETNDDGNYGFYSNNTAELEEQLQRSIDGITANLGSASGLSVVTSSVQSAGSVVQALYIPETTKTLNDGTTSDPVYWTGSLSMYFVDDSGDLREDNGTTVGTLDANDTVFRLDFDPILQRTQAIRDPGGTADLIELSDLVPIWEASDVLGNYDQVPTAGVGELFLTQRPYGTAADPATGYRHILTNLNGNVVDFVWDDDATSEAINPSNFTLLARDSAGDDVDLDGDDWDADDQALAQAKAQDLIAFTRGQEGRTEMRNRTLPDENPLLLGDVLHSTPAQVDVPNDSINLLFPDVAETYANFKDHYDNVGRRRMVYVGGNDGMLHAFNGGFWDPNSVTFSTSNPKSPGATEHALGAEIWSFIPYNLLPHLKWVADPSYNSALHVAYVDGAVQTFDARIFTDDTDHPDGWGTILVVGMSLGGGVFPEIDDDADESTADITTRPAYIVLDVTNPEEPPELIAEITDPALGLTTGKPTVVREVNGSGVVEWFLVFGSGPTDIQTSTSDQQARVFKYNLTSGAQTEIVYGPANSFTGDIVAQDWNFDYTQEAVYFGSVEGTSALPSGSLNRLFNGSVTEVIDVNQPVPFRPTMVGDRAGNNWLLFGSGRLFDSEDFRQDDQNSFYGVKEALDSLGTTAPSTVTRSSLVDVTNVTVQTDGGISGISLTDADGNPIDTFNGFKQYMRTTGAGWYLDLPIVNSLSSRSSAEPLVFRDFLFFTDFLPPVSDGNACTNEFGTSSLYAVDFSTGTPFVTDNFDGLLGETGGDLVRSEVIGEGIAATSSLLIVPQSDGRTGIRIKVPLSTGEIGDKPIPLPPTVTGRKSWTEVPLAN